MENKDINIFIGEMMEFKSQTTSQLTYINTKLDSALSNNRKDSAVISGILGVLINAAALFIKH